MAASADTAAHLVFDPLVPGSVATWSDAEALLAISTVGRLLLGDEWQEGLADLAPAVHHALTTWTHGVIAPATSQPDLAIARVRFVEAVRAAMSQSAKED